MSNILITGEAGAGKSYLAKKWAEKGINTVDGDAMEEVCQWVAPNGEIVPFPEDIALADVDWFKQHTFIWNEEKLQEFLKKNEPVIILGISDNIFDITKYFDRAYDLHIPYPIAIERLLRPDRQESNAFGRHEEQQLLLKEMIADHDKKTREYGLNIIDATLSAEEILDLVDLT